MVHTSRWDLGGGQGSFQIPHGTDRRCSLFFVAWLSTIGSAQIYDPTATLSAERRGTLSLPDIESCCAGAKGRYSAKVST